MEFIEGMQLDRKIWLALSEDDRTQICAKIARQLKHLRTVPSEGYYGRVHKQGWRGKMSAFRTDGTKLHGPYETYEDFVSDLYATFEYRTALCTREMDWLPEDEDQLRRFKPTLLAAKAIQPTLTYVDVALANVRCRKVQATGEWEVVLVDWSDLGWYPAWLQSVQLRDIHNLRVYVKATDSVDTSASREFSDKIRGHMGDVYPELDDFFDEMMLAVP